LAGILGEHFNILNKEKFEGEPKKDLKWENQT
jgi:hypothetical protein